MKSLITNYKLSHFWFKHWLQHFTVSCLGLLLPLCTMSVKVFLFCHDVPVVSHLHRVRPLCLREVFFLLQSVSTVQLVSFEVDCKSHFSCYGLKHEPAVYVALMMNCGSVKLWIRLTSQLVKRKDESHKLSSRVSPTEAVLCSNFLTHHCQVFSATCRR